MRRRIYIGAAVAWALSLVAAYLAGKHDGPTKETETTVRVDESARFAAFLASLETRQVATTRRHVETRTTRKPDGTVERTRIEDSGTDTASTATSNVTGHSSETTASTAATARVTERGRPGWSAGVSASWDPGRLSLTPDRLGLELDRRIVGTLWLGVRASAHGTSDPQIGAALRMEW